MYRVSCCVRRQEMLKDLAEAEANSDFIPFEAVGCWSGSEAFLQFLVEKSLEKLCWESTILRHWTGILSLCCWLYRNTWKQMLWFPSCTLGVEPKYPCRGKPKGKGRTYQKIASTTIQAHKPGVAPVKSFHTWLFASDWTPEHLKMKIPRMTTAVSHAWESMEHPDPWRFQLAQIANWQSGWWACHSISKLKSTIRRNSSSKDHVFWKQIEV